MSTMYVGFLEPERISRVIKDRVKEFIVGVSRDQDCYWEENGCSIWDYDKGTQVSVNPGSRYSKDNFSIYLKHRPGDEIPDWLPGALSAIAQFYRIGDDPEISDAIVTLAAKLAAGIFRPIQQHLAQTFNGVQIVHLAVNPTQHLLAGEYPADPNDPDGESIWGLQLSAEPVDVNTPEWSRFSLQA